MACPSCRRRATETNPQNEVTFLPSSRVFIFTPVFPPTSFHPNLSTHLFPPSYSISDQNSNAFSPTRTVGKNGIFTHMVGENEDFTIQVGVNSEGIFGDVGEDAYQPTNIVNCFYPAGRPESRSVTVLDSFLGPI